MSTRLEPISSTATRELRVEIRRGDAALELFGRPGFREAWRALHEACPWATAFQDTPFVDVWYRTYRPRFAPVVVTGWTDTTLTGLLLLAVSLDGTTLCHVGSHHAEYQVWLATDERFVGAALDALASTFPGRRLQLLFVPPDVPFAPPERWRSRCFRRPIAAPMLSTNPADAVRVSLRKKSNKSKFGRLTRRGKYTFERVRDDAAFAGLLEEIVPLYELRQGAAHDALPFRDDDLKRAFYLALQRETDLLHVTVMRVDDELIAAHIGMRSRNTVLAGMMAQSPRHAQHSSGKLLFFELALLLEHEGVEALDLTPGGEYKDRFATRYEEASTVTILFSHSAARRHRLKRSVIDAVKRRGISTDSVKRAIRTARHTISHLRPADLPLKVARRLKRAVWHDIELRIYRFPGGAPAAQAETLCLARDQFEDLACYEPSERWQPTTTAFLQSAMERLGNGEHCYTYVDDGVLAHYGWLVECQESTFMEEVKQSWRLPPGSAVLYGFYTHPRFRGRGLYAAALRRMLRDVAVTPGLSEVYIGVRADNGPSRRVIEKVGFVYDRSFYEQRRLARVRRWAGTPDGDGAPART
jgi:CelD/BcsL family acetyltransferase involved in cellulose biosynthesis/RimJ/RimL family protein N-acetyltransferase